MKQNQVRVVKQMFDKPRKKTLNSIPLPIGEERDSSSATNFASAEKCPGIETRDHSGAFPQEQDSLYRISSQVPEHQHHREDDLMLVSVASMPQQKSPLPRGVRQLQSTDYKNDPVYKNLNTAAGRKNQATHFKRLQRRGKQDMEVDRLFSQFDDSVTVHENDVALNTYSTEGSQQFVHTGQQSARGPEPLLTSSNFFQLNQIYSRHEKQDGAQTQRQAYFSPPAATRRAPLQQNNKCAYDKETHNFENQPQRISTCLPVARHRQVEPNQQEFSVRGTNELPSVSNSRNGSLVTGINTKQSRVKMTDSLLTEATMNSYIKNQAARKRHATRQTTRIMAHQSLEAPPSIADKYRICLSDNDFSAFNSIDASQTNSIKVHSPTHHASNFTDNCKRASDLPTTDVRYSMNDGLLISPPSVRDSDCLHGIEEMSMRQSCDKGIFQLHKKIDKAEIDLVNNEEKVANRKKYEAVSQFSQRQITTSHTKGKKSAQTTRNSRSSSPKPTIPNDFTFFHHQEEHLRSQQNIYDKAMKDFIKTRMPGQQEESTILHRVKAGFAFTQQKYERHLEKIHRAYKCIIETKEYTNQKLEKEFFSFKKANDLDEFFAAHLSKDTRAELVDRIEKFIDAPDWSEDVLDHAQLDNVKVSDAEELLGKIVDFQDELKKQVKDVEERTQVDETQDINQSSCPPMPAKVYSEQFNQEHQDTLLKASKMSKTLATKFWLNYFMKKRESTHTQTEKLDEVIMALEDAVRKSEQELDIANAQNAKLLVEMKRYKDQHQVQMAKVVEADKSLVEVNKKLRHAKKELLLVDGLKREIAEWEQRFIRTKKNFTDLESEFKSESSQRVELQNINTQLESKIEDLDESVVKLKESNESQKKDFEMLRKRYRNFVPAGTGSFRTNMGSEARDAVRAGSESIAGVSESKAGEESPEPLSPGPAKLGVKNKPAAAKNNTKKTTAKSPTKSPNKKAPGQQKSETSKERVDTNASKERRVDTSPSKERNEDESPGPIRKVKSKVPNTEETVITEELHSLEVDDAEDEESPILEQYSREQKQNIVTQVKQKRPTVNMSPNSINDDFSPKIRDATESSFYVAGDDRTAQANFSDESYYEQKDLIQGADNMNPKMNIEPSPKSSLKKPKLTGKQSLVGKIIPKREGTFKNEKTTPKAFEKFLVDKKEEEKKKSTSRERKNSIIKGKNMMNKIAGSFKKKVQEMRKQSTQQSSRVVKPRPETSKRTKELETSKSPTKTIFSRQKGNQPIHGQSQLRDPSDEDLSEQSDESIGKVANTDGGQNQRQPIILTGYEDPNIYDQKIDLAMPNMDAITQQLGYSENNSRQYNNDDRSTRQNDLPVDDSIAEQREANFTQESFNQLSKKYYQNPTPTNTTNVLPNQQQFPHTQQFVQNLNIQERERRPVGRPSPIEEESAAVSSQKSKSNHKSVVYVQQMKPSPVTVDATCQTEQELMLVVAADLFLSELEGAIEALRKHEHELCGLLNIQSFRELDNLRLQAKTIIGRIKTKAYRGISIKQKPGTAYVPSNHNNPNDQTQMPQVVFAQNYEQVIAEQKQQYAHTSWHFAVNDRGTSTLPYHESKRGDKPIMLHQREQGNNLNLVSQHMRTKYTAHGNPMTFVLQVNNGKDITNARVSPIQLATPSPNPADTTQNNSCDAVESLNMSRKHQTQ